MVGFPHSATSMWKLGHSLYFFENKNDSTELGLRKTYDLSDLMSFGSEIVKYDF